MAATIREAMKIDLVGMTVWLAGDRILVGPNGGRVWCIVCDLCAKSRYFCGSSRLCGVELGIPLLGYREIAKGEGGKKPY